MAVQSLAYSELEFAAVARHVTAPASKQGAAAALFETWYLSSGEFSVVSGRVASVTAGQQKQARN
jgi:hypothetical protein